MTLGTDYVVIVTVDGDNDFVKIYFSPVTDSTIVEATYRAGFDSDKVGNGYQGNLAAVEQDLVIGSDNSGGGPLQTNANIGTLRFSKTEAWSGAQVQKVFEHLISGVAAGGSGFSGLTVRGNLARRGRRLCRRNKQY
jgi:hypothetical protein